MPSLGQGSHELGNLFPQLCCPFPLSQSLAWPLPSPCPRFPHFQFLPCGWKPSAVSKRYWGTIKVLNGVTNVFTNPMKEAVLEVLLGLKVHHPPRAL